MENAFTCMRNNNFMVTYMFPASAALVSLSLSS